MLRYIAILLLGLASPALSDGEGSRLEKSLRSYLASGEFVSAYLELVDPPVELQSVHRRHASMISASPVFEEFIVSEILQIADILDNGSGGVATDEAIRFGMAIGQAKVVEGVKYLTVEEQREFYRFGIYILERVPVEMCASAIVGSVQADAIAFAEIEAISRLSVSATKRYLFLNRKALFGAIEGDLSFSPLTDTELEVASRLYSQSLIDRIDKERNAEELYSALGYPETADPDTLCQASIIAIEAALDVTGTAGGWVVEMLSQSE